MYKNNTVATTEIIDPKLEIKFQAAKASGQSGIRRGIPARPKKC